MYKSLLPFFLPLFLALPQVAFAQIAITEVLWAGSDLSSSDEWIELQNYSETEVDLSQWSVTYLTSKGEDGLIVRFGTGVSLEAGEFMIVSRHHADASRLLLEPDLVTTSMSLLNTKLLLKIKDQAGVTVDTVDDGVGSPFAGANPSGGTKASMERIDPSKPGNDASNWQTATVSLGLDSDAKVFATPGYETDHEGSSSSSSSSSSVCSDDFDVQIYVQDGSLTGDTQTTVNFQAIATRGSIENVSCHWTFSDGYSSDSCNPPPHSFEKSGVTIVNLEATSQCGNTLIREVQVVLSGGSEVVGTSSSASTFDGSRIRLSSALPNPATGDSGKEWVELRNLEDHPVSLVGWKLVTGNKTLRQYPLKGTIDIKQRLRYYDKEISFTLPNGESKIVLRNPEGKDVSTMSWMKTTEGRVYFPDDIRSADVQGTASYVVDGDTFVLELQGEAREMYGEDSVIVRLLGIAVPELRVLSDESDIGLQSLKFLKALIEKKKVELEFDTELWDSDGRLLAYVYDDRGILTQNQLLSMGLASVSDSLEFTMKESFILAQEKAKNLKLGQWKFLAVSPLNRSVQVSKDLINTEVRMSDVILDLQTRILISEIYSNPILALDKDDKVLTISGSSLEAQEWLEIFNPTDKAVELGGLSLSINGKKKVIPFRFIVGSNEFVVISDLVLNFDIRNTGGDISLSVASGGIIHSLQYPAMKPGQSYQLLEGGSYCLSDISTPNEQNNCTKKSPVMKAKTSKSTKKKSISRIATEYAPIFAREQRLDSGESLELPTENFFSDRSNTSVLFIAFLMGLLGSLIWPSLLRLLKMGK